MVVDDVEKNREAARMTGLDQPFQFLGPAIAGRRRIKVGAVIAPVAAAGELGNRHQLDRGRAEFTNMIKVRDRAGKIAGLGEGAEMQFVENDLLPGPPAPFSGVPHIGAGIDHLARAVNPLRLPTRGRVRIGIAIDNIAVAGARPGAAGCQGEPPSRFGTHRQKRVGELQRHRPGARRPQAKSDPFGIQLGSERKLMMPAHDHPCLVTETVLEP